ncbi:MAG: roadblock/LC7 domain-containing protein, partial [Verrucomicrobia bacterium]|nr:roadblock/LC7 domain-containing protein [Verrucomicrobiota bacterium]
MDISDSAPPPEADFTAALPLDISEETASRTDDLLREFAEEARLDTALVVDRSGALVAGISSEAEVTVEVVSALVAGASGAMRALVAQLGESGAMESLHLGGNRLIYLKETVGTFILVAVAEAVRPAGLVRQRALAIEGRLQDLLRDLRPADPAFPAGPASPAVKSLRETVRERAARRLGDAVPPMFPALPVATGAEPVFELDPGEDEEDEEDEEECVPEAEHEETPEGASGFGESFELPCDEEPGIEEVFGTLDLQSEAADTAVDVEASADDLAEDETGTEPSPIAGQTLSDLPKETPPLPPPVEPKEILEPIDFGEPEIVIEAALPEATGSRRLQVPQPPVDSPFEAEEDDEEKEDEDKEDSDDPEIGGLDSVFEFDAEG